MVAFLPDSSLTLARLLALWGVTLLAGFAWQYGEPRPSARLRAWALAVSAFVLAHLMTLSCPPGFRMLSLITAGLLGMKAVVGVSARLEGSAALSLPRWLAFAAPWPGMDPGIFAVRNPGALPGSGPLWLEGSLCAFLGTALMVLSRTLWEATHSAFLVTVLFFIGSSLLVHYGFFTLMAAFWRGRGFGCDRLFKNPFEADNLGDFWGKKWNLAFKEMTWISVYRPMARAFPHGEVLLVSFGLSGLLHEAAISLPVMAGFGLPFAYFLLQGGLVALERSLFKRGMPIHGWVGRIWVLFWLILPLPILFHKPFLAGVVWPLIGVKP